MKEFTITQNDAGQRLDRWIAKAIPLLPASLAQKYIRLKRIKLNGKRAERDTRLITGDTLQLYINDEFFDTPKEENAYLTVAAPKLHIVYEDENILLVDKKPGQAVHPHDGAEYGKTLIDHIQAYLYAKREWRPREEHAFTPALCNRLDRNTSGIVIAGKTLQGVQAVNEIIRSRKLNKFYLTLVAGEIHEAGEITAYLTKDTEKNQVRISKREGSGARTMTKYRPLAHAKGYTLLEIQLITGKTHQIRAHMQAIGHPVAGDRKYGSEATNRKFREEYALSNQFLHALRVEWKEQEGPLGYLYGKEMTAPLPKQLQEICDGLFGRAE